VITFAGSGHQDRCPDGSIGARSLGSRKEKLMMMVVSRRHFSLRAWILVAGVVGCSSSGTSHPEAGTGGMSGTGGGSMGGGMGRDGSPTGGTTGTGGAGTGGAGRKDAAVADGSVGTGGAGAGKDAAVTDGSVGTGGAGAGKDAAVTDGSAGTGGSGTGGAMGRDAGVAGGVVGTGGSGFGGVTGKDAAITGGATGRDGGVTGGSTGTDGAGTGGTTGAGGVGDTFAEALKVGASGYVTGIDIDPSGTTYLLRTDTYGGYVGDGIGPWAQVIRADTMPASFLDAFTKGTRQSLGEGIYEIRVAPSNPNVIYMVFGSMLYKSTNRAASWALLSSFPDVGVLDPNDGVRTLGEKAAIDPVNPDVAYIGTVEKGLYVTTNGGSTFAQIPTSQVPIATHDAGITGIVFDSAGGVVDGKTKVIYACSNGNGVYRSADAGATWAKQTGGPTKVSHAAVAKDGVYYAATFENGSMFRYMNGAWTSADTGLQSAFSVAPDPSDAARIVAGRDSGHLAVSTDRGATWGDVLWEQTLAAGDVPHLMLSSGTYLSAGRMLFDPVAPDKLWLSAGYGVWITKNTHVTYPTSVVWEARSSGIEQIVARDICVPPGSSNVIAAGEDRSVWVLPRANTSYPTTNVTFGTNDNQRLARSVDYSRANPLHIVALVNHGLVGEPELSGYSLDDGSTWTRFPTQPGSGGQAGDIIAPSIDSIIVVVGRKYAYRSTDRGSSWRPLSLPGDSGTDSEDLHCGYNCNKHILAVDGADPNTVYLYFYTHGVYKSTDAGASWTLVSDSDFDGGNMYWQVKLRSVPGQAGHLFLTAGQAGGDGNQNPQNTALYRSTNGGATWTTVPDFAEPYDIGMGAPAPGRSYPAMYVVGWYKLDYGIWRSVDNAATWKKLTSFPFGSLDLINVVAASQDSFGEIYFAFQGSGWGKLVNSVP
jgi:hypothetical protein